MLDARIKKKLESIRDLPTVPVVLYEVLQAVDNLDLSAKGLASIIEKDQALTARVLRVSNSPFYGFSRRISTIDLAVIILGLNTIKEIVLSLVLKKLFTKVDPNLFDIENFWNYSIFCGAAAKYLAKKLDYRLSGEAFVAGLMHDIGILIIIHYFEKDFIKIRELQTTQKLNLLEAEQRILNSAHSEIGAWLAEKWQLPEKLVDAISNHHNNYNDYLKTIADKQEIYKTDDYEIYEPLTVIVAMAEWFANSLGFKNWSLDNNKSSLFFEKEHIELINSNDILNYDSSLDQIKTDLLNEYEKALRTHSLY